MSRGATDGDFPDWVWVGVCEGKKIGEGGGGVCLVKEVSEGERCMPI